MSSAREAVVWLYKDSKQIWSSQDYKRLHKLRQAPVYLMYKEAESLWNLNYALGMGVRNSFPI